MPLQSLSLTKSNVTHTGLLSTACPPPPPLPAHVGTPHPPKCARAGTVNEGPAPPETYNYPSASSFVEHAGKLEACPTCQLPLLKGHEAEETVADHQCHDGTPWLLAVPSPDGFGFWSVLTSLSSL
jgi:hypothetical protein